MTPTVHALEMIVATLVMLVAGLSRKRLEWKPLKVPRKRRPPRSA